MPDFHDAKPGDRTYVAFGNAPDREKHNATVVRLERGTRYPVIMELDGKLGMKISFTYDGKNIDYHDFPSAFWSKPTDFVDPPAPKRIVRKIRYLVITPHVHDFLQIDPHNLTEYPIARVEWEEEE